LINISPSEVEGPTFNYYNPNANNSFHKTTPIIKTITPTQHVSDIQPKTTPREPLLIIIGPVYDPLVVFAGPTKELGWGNGGGSVVLGPDEVDSDVVVVEGVDVELVVGTAQALLIIDATVSLMWSAQESREQEVEDEIVEGQLQRPVSCVNMCNITTI